MAAGKEKAEEANVQDELGDSLNHLFTSISAMVKAELQVCLKKKKKNLIF